MVMPHYLTFNFKKINFGFAHLPLIKISGSHNIVKLQLANFLFKGTCHETF